MNIFLLGFMGSGKTTLGKYLGRKFELEFIDLDQRVESFSGKTIPDIFSEDGEAVFRKWEQQALHSIQIDSAPKIVSCGGGTPCFFDNMEWMNSHGHTIYLQLSPEVLLGRLRKAQSGRPLIEQSKDLEKRIQDLFSTREVYYLQAQTLLEGKKADRKYLREVVENLLER